MCSETKQTQKRSKLLYNVSIFQIQSTHPITNKYKKISLEINEKSIKEIVQNIYKNDLAKKLIFVSTCSNYGVSKKKYINETHKLKPLSPYAKSKVKVEKLSFIE